MAKLGMKRGPSTDAREEHWGCKRAGMVQIGDKRCVLGDV